MGEMRAKKVRRVCDVRGCRNVECYTVTRICEVGNSVIICRDCAQRVLAAIDSVDGTQFVCANCGKVCQNKAGLVAHMKTCKGGD